MAIRKKSQKLPAKCQAQLSQSVTDLSLEYLSKVDPHLPPPQVIFLSLIVVRLTIAVRRGNILPVMQWCFMALIYSQDTYDNLTIEGIEIALRLLINRRLSWQ